MKMRSLICVAGCALGAAAMPSMAFETVFETPNPFGGWFGINGFDVSTQQDTAARFEATQPYTLSQVGVWFMSNESEGIVPQIVTFTLRTDIDPPGEYVSVPSDTILETWTVNLNTIGWEPVQVWLDSNINLTLEPGVKYWVVAESQNLPLENPVWNFSGIGNSFTATRGFTGSWESGSGAALTITVMGTLIGGGCGTADFDGDGDSGTDADIEAFFSCLAGDCCPTCFGADFDNDGDTGTDADIEAFFRVLAGGAC